VNLLPPQMHEPKPARWAYVTAQQA